ncbi:MULTISPECIES: hypothetical protein [unclassified Novosphingobium]|uniref:F0F1 ATP synthase subunit B family protein n=1 Tax=Novosphingobium TaxID=165696 RepID=UPI0014475870|nr:MULTISPECIES: hypothetical protein [unclassified Novosphingobium]NKJ41285.1 F-type H+-transporting ATPase subunit b [Novosphingobium sp. SG720]NMN03536.1 F-type H+-transporting ATPase subunit b [Novosphingobium sp. SG919]NMN86474.1 F-type H+-transporting ATPase subunit b [Novosphingobium sp. SG916]
MANVSATTATVEQHAAGHEAAEPTINGIGAGAIVAAAMFVFLLILVWKKVPGTITKGLDGQIAAIRRELADAKALRAEAEALRAEYLSRIANAEKDAAAMLDHARTESSAIVAKAEADTRDIIARREKMASDKIAAAERAAVDDLRATAAAAAAAAAGQIIAARHGADADKVLVDSAIAGLTH